MSTFVMGCCRAYRRIARAFPHQYRAICGDGLEQLGEDLSAACVAAAGCRRVDSAVWGSRVTSAMRTLLNVGRQIEGGNHGR